MMTISGMQLFGIWWNTFEVFRNIFKWNLLTRYVEKRFSPPAWQKHFGSYVLLNKERDDAKLGISSYSKNRCIIRIFSHTRFVRCYLRELLFRKNRKVGSVWRFTFKSGSSNILNIQQQKFPITTLVYFSKYLVWFHSKFEPNVSHLWEWYRDWLAPRHSLFYKIFFCSLSQILFICWFGIVF